MPVYVAMLRGINVGGNRLIKMDALRRSFETLGFMEVKTYIQSGNVVFKAAKSLPDKLSKRIENKLESDFGFAVPVVTRAAEEIGRAIEGNPFFGKHGIDETKLHVMFLSATPAADALKKLTEFAIAPERAQRLEKEIHLYLPNGVAESKLMKAPLDRILSVRTTTRNWKTVHALHQMCKDCG
jgi:uncharacterized protein (DUF1697 family)